MILPEKLLYAEIEVRKERATEVLEKLGRWGFFHLDTKGKSEFKNPTLSKLEEIAEYLKISKPSQNGEKTLNEEELESIYGQILALKEKELQIKRENELLTKAERLNASFEGEITSLVKSLKYISLKVGKIKREVYDKLKATLKAKKIYGVFSELEGGEIAAAIFSTAETDLESLLSPFKIRFVPLKYFLPEEKEKIEKEKTELKEKLEKLKKKYNESLIKTYHQLKLKAKLKSLLESLEKRGNILIIKGWIPEEKKEELKKLLKGFKIKFSPPGENPPTLVKTPKFLKPIEEIVFSYSYPSYEDVNPVLPFLFVFLLLFGIMFGDVGHGILLSTVSLILERKGKKAVGRLMFLSGISSTLFGFLYGSVFGKEMLEPILFTPMKKIELMLLTSIAVGILVITLGFAIKVISRIRHKKLEELIFGEEGLLYFTAYWLILGITLKVLVLEMDVKVELTLLLLILTASFLYTYKKTKEATSSFMESIREVFENLINTLSFMRLGAFALAHGALFFAIFTIAENVKSVKGGSLIYWLIVTTGNLLVVALEGLVVTIQALRLNYYEFFKKFYKGGGRPFKPFKLEEA